MNLLVPTTLAGRRLLDQLAPEPRPDGDGRYTVVDVIREERRELLGASICAIENEVRDIERVAPKWLRDRGLAESARVAALPHVDSPETPDEELVEPYRRGLADFLTELHIRWTGGCSESHRADAEWLREQGI